MRVDFIEKPKNMSERCLVSFTAVTAARAVIPRFFSRSRFVS